MSQEEMISYYCLHDGDTPLAIEQGLKNTISGFYGEVIDSCETDGWIAFSIPRKSQDECISLLKKYHFNITMTKPKCEKCL